MEEGTQDKRVERGQMHSLTTEPDVYVRVFLFMCEKLLWESLFFFFFVKL